MGVKLRKRGSRWYVVIDYHGRRKSKCVGAREAAEKVKREVEAKLALGELGVLDKNEGMKFRDYAHRWMDSCVKPNLKPSTVESYEVILRVHLLPRFGEMPLKQISRAKVRELQAEMVRAGAWTRNTVKNVFAILRALFTQAIEDDAATFNPATRLGKFNKAEKEGRKVEFLTEAEADSFLSAVRALRPERYPFFLCALRTGLRLGELLALEWDDVQFGQHDQDSNRFIMVRHNIVRGIPGEPKSRKPRRVDLNRELRQALLELRDARMLEAFAHGESKATGLVFPSQTGAPLDSRNVYHRDFLPCLQAAGLRRVTFHALRHSFASHLIQHGASLVYVREQLGHSSIAVTVNFYGHLEPGRNIEWVDALGTTPQESATPAQPKTDANESGVQVFWNGRRGGTRTPDPRIRNPMLYPPELHARVSSLSYRKRGGCTLSSGCLVVTHFDSMEVSISSIVQTWSVTPASIAGVTRKVE